LSFLHYICHGELAQVTATTNFCINSLSIYGSVEASST